MISFIRVPILIFFSKLRISEKLKHGVIGGERRLREMTKEDHWDPVS